MVKTIFRDEFRHFSGGDMYFRNPKPILCGVPKVRDVHHVYWLESKDDVSPSNFVSCFVIILYGRGIVFELG